MQRRNFISTIVASVGALGLIKAIPTKVTSPNTISHNNVRCQELFTYAGCDGKYRIIVSYLEDLSSQIQVVYPDKSYFVLTSDKSYEDERRKYLYNKLTCDHNMNVDVADSFVTQHMWTEWYEFGGPVEPNLLTAYYNPKATLIAHSLRFGNNMVLA